MDRRVVGGDHPIEIKSRWHNKYIEFQFTIVYNRHVQQVVLSKWQQAVVAAHK